MTSLNPVYTVGEQIAEVVRRHEGLGRRAALAKTVDMLKLVQIPNPQRRVRDYPHQFSGGMRQRVMIAMALVLQPQAPDRRRADHRARRHHPGADPGAAGRPQVALRHGHHADHPRHGRGGRDGAARGGDVCRQGHRGGPGRAAVRPPLHPYTQGPHPLDPAHRPGRHPQDAAGGHRRGGAEPAQPSARLPLCAALPLRRCRSARRPCRRCASSSPATRSPACARRA